MQGGALTGAHVRQCLRERACIAPPRRLRERAGIPAPQRWRGSVCLPVAARW